MATVDELKQLGKTLRVQAESLGPDDRELVLQCVGVLDDEMKREAPRMRAMKCMVLFMVQQLASSMSDQLKRCTAVRP